MDTSTPYGSTPEAPNLKALWARITAQGNDLAILNEDLNRLKIRVQNWIIAE